MNRCPEHAPPRFNPPEVNAHLNPSIQTILAFVRCARWCQHAHSCVDEGRDGYVGFNSFLAEQMRTSIPKVTNGVMKVAMASQKYARVPGSKQRMPMAPINPFIASDAEEVKSRCNAYANGGTKDGISKH